MTEKSGQFQIKSDVKVGQERNPFFYKKDFLSLHLCLYLLCGIPARHMPSLMSEPAVLLDRVRVQLRNLRTAYLASAALLLHGCFAVLLLLQ